MTTTAEVLLRYLDLMDLQRQTTFAVLAGLTDTGLWTRPASKEWCVGEILDHNNRLYNTFYPMVKSMWTWFYWYGSWKRARPYPTETQDVYRSPGFPHWVGFLWPPKHTPAKPVPLDTLKLETEALHGRVREFYTGKDPDVLGNLYLFDPLFGWCNLITTLRIGIYHDQLHYEDVLKLAAGMK